MDNIGAAAGDGVFVLGFPMNLNGTERNFVIARSGIIARLPEPTDVVGPRATFLVDSLIFPGNSGGPVILRADIQAIEGTKANLQAFLIGLVVGYVSYTDTAVSTQTGHARVTFEENSGLAEVVPVDAIEDTIAAWHRVQPALSVSPQPAVPGSQ